MWTFLPRAPEGLHRGRTPPFHHQRLSALQRDLLLFSVTALYVKCTGRRRDLSMELGLESRADAKSAKEQGKVGGLPVSF